MVLGHVVEKGVEVVNTVLSHGFEPRNHPQVLRGVSPTTITFGQPPAKWGCSSDNRRGRRREYPSKNPAPDVKAAILE
ncbi:hypothetical protein HSRCO_0816 [Halanaeroarchaeum sp. HSR-CO]|nr:hypothetical protein HSRCO_0816 [Halanaeroarchaeum sp. HSR-CO]